MNESRKAIILLSGGLDSTTTLAIAHAIKPALQLYALSFRYGQKNQFELQCARENAARYDIKEHKILDLNLSVFSGSSLTSTLPVEKNRTREQIGQGIPSTYVPARNTIFLSYSLAWADVLGATEIFIGANAVDSSGYPDCRKEYLDAFCNLANLATKTTTTTNNKFTLHAPLIALSKAEIISQGLALGVDYGLTSTCYDPEASGKPCGTCDSCTLRRLGFEALSLSDPLTTCLK